MVVKNHFCIFTQLAFVIGTCIPVCLDCAAHVPKSGTCPLLEACRDIGADFLGPPHRLCDATPEHLRKAATTSTATTVVLHKLVFEASPVQWAWDGSSDNGH
ncbi:hypothetical protein MRX96_042082 [Rhipicephalus microplus]